MFHMCRDQGLRNAFRCVCIRVREPLWVGLVWAQPLVDAYFEDASLRSSRDCLTSAICAVVFGCERGVGDREVGDSWA